jgi:RNA polymerase sigma factor (sigma-70 family)
VTTKTLPARELVWTDEKLVRECCDGNEAAWSALIEKYKNLIFSIPIKMGVPREDAGDIFQSVCVELLAGLPKLREPRALPKWLMQVSYHKSLQWKKDQMHAAEDELQGTELPSINHSELPYALLEQLQKEQSLRDSLLELAPRCRQIVTMLFFEHPPRAYADVAKDLGIATGSIGFIRGRCLKKLRQLLEERGFE